MRLEIFPYRFRGKANAAVLYRRGSGIVELKGARALYDLYMSGASFRTMRNSPIDAVVFDLDDLTAEDADKLDNLKLDNVFVAKSPSSVLQVPGKENRRKVFFDLGKECPYSDYCDVYGNAFMQFIGEAGLRPIAYDHCMDSPRQMTFGRPYPDMEMSVYKMDIEGLGEMRVPMPMCRYDARELFGIDGKVLLPSVEYFARRRPDKGERYTFIWKKIIPAAFSWFRFFETTTETRWGLSSSGFRFNDCLRAIERELTRIGVPGQETAEVIRGNLKDAYLHFSDPPLTAYSPRVGAKKRTQWDKTSPERRKEIYAKQSMQAKGKRRLLNAMGREKLTPGRKPTLKIRTMSDLEALYAAGKISKPYYYRKRKEMARAPRKGTPGRKAQ